MPQRVLVETLLLAWSPPRLIEVSDAPGECVMCVDRASLGPNTGPGTLRIAIVFEGET